ncbi:hypothetical protein [Rubrivirga sp.]|uniref:hypothetical protein n=1 Tax=Rubrivirga sp. TaxID=1885344 RepID=UPI003B529E3F
MNAPALPLADVTDRALRALAREIGVADTARFLQQFGAGRGDYTKDREALFGHLSLQDVLEQSKRYGRGPAEVD